MNKFILIIFSFYVFNCHSQISLNLEAGGSQDLKISASLTSSYNGQSLTGYFFVLRSPIVNGMPTVNLAGATSGSGLPAPVLQSVSSTTSGGFFYQMYESNAASNPLAGWGAGANNDVIYFNLDGGVGTGQIELADDAVSDMLINDYYGGGTSDAVFGSDIILDGNPTVIAYIDPLELLVLPIKLKYFTADRFNNERASDLKWSSSSEVNADYFDVERSADGFNFEFIGKVKAAGNSNTEQNYSMLDRSIPNSRNQQDVFYYRLKMVDLDGQFEYSDVRSVRFDNESNIDVATYPNPTSGKLYVNISTPDYDETLSTDAFLYDLSGRLVMKRTVSTKGITEIDLDNVTNGAYNVSISHNGKSYQNRIIKTN